jgi:hypothetical protein
MDAPNPSRALLGRQLERRLVGQLPATLAREPASSILVVAVLPWRGRRVWCRWSYKQCSVMPCPRSKVPLLVPACYRLSCVRGVVVPSAPPPLVPVPARPFPSPSLSPPLSYMYMWPSSLPLDSLSPSPCIAQPCHRRLVRQSSWHHFAFLLHHP